MDTANLKLFRLDTALTGYMPIPPELIGADLPSTAVLIYPVKKLAEAFHISNTAVKRHLRELELQGLSRSVRLEEKFLLTTGENNKIGTTTINTGRMRAYK